jgi:hypothetical protein
MLTDQLLIALQNSNIYRINKLVSSLKNIMNEKIVQIFVVTNALLPKHK